MWNYILARLLPLIRTKAQNGENIFPQFWAFFTHLIRGRGYAMKLLVFLIHRSWRVKTSAQSGVHLSAPPFSDNEACISSFQAITARPVWDISSSPLFFLYISIQLPLNLDQIACSGRFSSPHLAKRLSRKKILCTVWKVSSLLMIFEMAGLGKSTLALSQLLS